MLSVRAGSERILMEEIRRASQLFDDDDDTGKISIRNLCASPRRSQG
jgi:Ca2+-binding EF-hand superfamily protein